MNHHEERSKLTLREQANWYESGQCEGPDPSYQHGIRTKHEDRKKKDGGLKAPESVRGSSVGSVRQDQQHLEKYHQEQRQRDMG
jgi:hypothetical protein